MRLVELCLYLGATEIAVEHSVDRRSIEACVDGETLEGVGVADLIALDEVGAQESLLELGLLPRLAGVLGRPQEPVREEGVGALCPVEVEVEAVARSHTSEVLDDLIGTLPPTELAGIGLAHGHRRPGRGRGVEQVGPEDDVDGVGMLVACECLLEPALPDVAPRAHHIGPDLHAHTRHDTTAMTSTAAATFCSTLVDEWVAAGLSAAMIAPGSRSTPMALALAAHPSVAVEVFHDERSAGFAALGWGLATGRPAVVLCSSGTAATHFHAAVVEADLSGIPMLVLTADRPPELVDVAAAQTIDQTHLFGRAVRWFHAPGVPDDRQSRTWRSLARRAYRASVDLWPGPVHLNLAFREPLVGDPGELPAGRGVGLSVSRPSVDPADLEVLLPLLEQQRGVIVAGAGAAANEREAADVAALAAATGWPVLADPRSGCRHLEQAVATADALLRHDRFSTDHTPTAVLHLGEPWASRIVNEWLHASGARHVHVSASPRVVDPGHVVEQWVTGSVGAICLWLAERLQGASGTTWWARWQHAELRARGAIDSCFAESDRLTEPLVARTLVDALGTAGYPRNLVVSSSMPIRDVEWYTLPAAGARVYSNRGANGIDGVIATAIGVGSAAGATAVLIGDVAFLHDASSLTALSRRGTDVRIVLVDNDGGGIFSFLPQASTVDPARFEVLYGTPHGTDLPALARAHDLRVTVVSGRGELLAALSQPGPSVTVVHSERGSNVTEHRRIHDAVHRSLD